MKLRTRILVTYIGLTMIGTFIVAAVAHRIARNELEVQQERRRTSILKTTSVIMGDSAIIGLSDHGRRSLLHAVAEHLNAGLILTGRNGNVLFNSGEAQDSGGLGKHGTPPETVDDTAFQIFDPLRGPFDSAFVLVSMPKGDLDEADRGIMTMVLLASLVALAIATSASLYLSRTISIPILDIVETIKSVKVGEVTRRITTSYPGEMGELAKAVNEMAEQLSLDLATRERLEGVRSEFLGNVSHELRTPLFSLQGFLETLMDGAVDDPTVNRDFLEKAYHHAERLNTLLTDLIEISRIESGEMKMSFRYFSVVDFLHAVVDELRTSAEKRNLTLRVDTEFDSSAKVYGDKARLRQVLTNLIDNGIKYTEPGGTITCIARPLRNQCEILVEDTGCGIPLEHLSRIFERFYRVDRDRSREVGGTGLGLAIAKHIVEAHGGALNVKSAIGKGSTFSFTVKR